MEEILASIRRIIEDNDTGRKPSDVDFARQDTEDAVAERTVIEVDAFRAELRTPPVKEIENLSRPDAPDGKPVTLAEVQAQIASGARFTPAPRWTPDVPLGPKLATVSEEAHKAADKPDAVVDSGATSRAMIEAFDEAASKPVSSENAVAMDDKPDAPSVPAINRPVPPEGARPVILSERAERKVAAAFGELSEAFAARSKKTFDDLAEEMMRPMLQDWLDNNLPVLVERLVREEIERVARRA
jgi:cell pole-organizing protein PopZ